MAQMFLASFNGFKSALLLHFNFPWIFFKISIVQPVITSCKIAQLIDQQCIVYNFKCDLNAMLVMLDTPVAICLYALMDIEENLISVQTLW